MVARLLTGLFLFCCGVIKRKKEQVYFILDIIMHVLYDELEEVKEYARKQII
jgi:hypothetical protein